MNARVVAMRTGLGPLLSCIAAVWFAHAGSHAASNQVSGSGWTYKPVKPLVASKEAAEVNSNSESQAQPGTSGALLVALPPYQPLWQPAVTNEPMYKGKPLSYWLLVERHASPLLSTPPKLDDDGREAVVAAGTNAMPFLLAWVDSAHAVEAFGVLGSLAEPAIPDLTRLATNPPPTTARLSAMRQHSIQTSAAAALWNIGADANSAICSIVTNRDAGPARLRLLGAIGWTGTSTLPWVPALTNCLKDDDTRIVSQALFALRLAHPADQGVFSAVVPLLHSPEPKVRSAAIQTIAPFGDEALPQMFHALSDTDDQVRIVALAELVQNAPKALTNANVLALGAEALRSSGQRQKWAAQLLRAAGQQAQGLKADLSVRLPGGWEAVLTQATNALRQLAPELLTNTPPHPGRPATRSAAQP